MAIRAPGAGEVQLETLYVSIDPAMRVWISENPGYVPRIEIGDVMRAFSTVDDEATPAISKIWVQR